MLLDERVAIRRDRLSRSLSPRESRDTSGQPLAEYEDSPGSAQLRHSAVFAGETNFLRIRGEGPQPSRYSAAATVAIDPSVTSSSPNQVKWLSVSRSGTQVTVRWQLQQANGKKFKVYFTRADTGQAVLLTQFPLASTSTNITFLDQALASPCGLFSITQTLADGSQETLPSTGAGLPSPGGGDVFGGNQGGCDPDPPPPPGPSGPTWVNTFHHRDHLGSLRVTTDAAGWMLSGHDFYPFGMEVAESGQAAVAVAESGDSQPASFADIHGAAMFSSTSETADEAAMDRN